MNSPTYILNQIQDIGNAQIFLILLQNKNYSTTPYYRIMAKRNNENLSISDALKEFVETNKLEKGLNKVNVADAWAKLMGNGVNNYTTSVNLERNTLYVQLNSSVLREELSYGKQKIIGMLNEELGKEIIKNLILR